MYLRPFCNSTSINGISHISLCWIARFVDQHNTCLRQNLQYNIRGLYVTAVVNMTYIYKEYADSDDADRPRTTVRARGSADR